MYLCWTLWQVSAMRCVPAEQIETAFLNLADENGSDEEVRSDRRDSRGLPETCERRDWRIRDPTWRKRDPTWRKSEKIGEKVNFVGKFFSRQEEQLLRTHWRAPVNCSTSQDHDLHRQSTSPRTPPQSPRSSHCSPRLGVRSPLPTTYFAALPQLSNTLQQQAAG